MREYLSSRKTAAGGLAVPNVRNEEIFEALSDEEAFARLPALVGQAVKARSGILHFRTIDRTFEVLCTWNFPSVKAYAENWAAHDPWFAVGLLPQTINRVGLSEEWVSQAQYEKSAIYNDFVRREGFATFHCMGGVFSTPFGEGSLGIHRDRWDAPFDRNDLELLRPLARTIGQALKLKGQILSARRDESRAKDSLDTLALAVITVDAAGRLLAANAAADAILRRGDGLAIRNGTLTARDNSDSRALKCAIAQAVSSADPRVTSLPVHRGENKEPYLLTTSPLLGRDGSKGAILIFRDRDRKDASLVDRLRALYNLTLSEAVVAVEIGNGNSPSDIADLRGVSANTLNTQIKSIMSKMNCSRQAQIAVIVAGLPSIRT